MTGGIGMAPMECPMGDPHNGRVANGSFTEHAVPDHANGPPITDVTFVEETTLT